MWVEMETATMVIVGQHNGSAGGGRGRGADVRTAPEGVKNEESDFVVTKKWVQEHLAIGIEAMTDIGAKGEQIKHFQY